MNHTILILAEKPSYTEALAPSISAKWPDSRVIAHYINFGGPYRFRYPRGLAWSSYPRIQDQPTYHLTSELWVPPREIANGHTTKVKPGDPANDLKQAMLEADKIVYACEPDYAGAHAFHVAVSECLGAGVAGQQSYPAISLRGLDEHSIRSAVAALTQFPDDFRPLLSYATTKRYFDYNFNMNALVILGRTLTTAGVDSSKYQLSKYAVQVLFHLKRDGGTSSNGLFVEMDDWHGTQKYAAKGGSAVHTRLGSIASIGNIVAGLQSAGLISDSDSNRGKASLTAKGECLLGLLHPDCEDRDLPFRLATWCEAGLEQSKASIDRYLKTFFGRQKRFIEAQTRTAEPLPLTPAARSGAKRNPRTG
jgi:hypothetical protein